MEPKLKRSVSTLEAFSIERKARKCADVFIALSFHRIHHSKLILTFLSIIVDTIEIIATRNNQIFHRVDKRQSSKVLKPIVKNSVKVEDVHLVDDQFKKKTSMNGDNRKSKNRFLTCITVRLLCSLKQN